MAEEITTYYKDYQSKTHLISSKILEQKRVDLRLFCDKKQANKFSGNKQWKLKYNLIEAQKQNFDTLLTFGGAYSNHISAVAAAGKLFNFKTIGIIRGEIIEPLNPTLAFARSQNMRLIPISRQNYQLRHSKDFIKQLQSTTLRDNETFIIPEGGTNALAVRGCAEVVEKIDQDFDFLCVPCGTGGTLAGLIAGAKGKGSLLGFSALKNGGFLRQEVQTLLDEVQCNSQNWKILTEYHWGGYAKFTQPLIDFMNTFKKEQGIQLDPIYTGKMMMGIYDLIQKDYFPKGSKIIAFHTGGLQGIEGFNQRFGNPLTT